MPAGGQRPLPGKTIGPGASAAHQWRMSRANSRSAHHAAGSRYRPRAESFPACDGCSRDGDESVGDHRRASRQNPSFNFNGSDVSLADNPAVPTSTPRNVTRLFERGQKRRWRLDVAHSTTDVTQSQYKDKQRQAELAVKTALPQMLGPRRA